MKAVRDDLLVGTGEERGLAIRFSCDMNGFFFIATHIRRIKCFWQPYTMVPNYSCSMLNLKPDTYP
jgi:hypothetical protein